MIILVNPSTEVVLVVHQVIRPELRCSCAGSAPPSAGASAFGHVASFRPTGVPLQSIISWILYSFIALSFYSIYIYVNIYICKYIYIYVNIYIYIYICKIVFLLRNCMFHVSLDPEMLDIKTVKKHRNHQELHWEKQWDNNLM